MCWLSTKRTLKYLKNKWFFKQIGESSEIDFQIDFELKNKILNLLMTKFFDIGLKKIADSFDIDYTDSNHIQVVPDESLCLDVTVIMGADYRKFAELIEHISNSP